jgi:hypothetical protein
MAETLEPDGGFMKQALTVFALSLSLSGLALAQQTAPGPTAKGNEGKANITAGGTTITLSEVNAKKLERIKEIGLTVFYPTFVPDRFSLARVTLTKPEEFWQYHLRFCDKRHLCFTVEAVNEDQGDAEPGEFRVLKGKSALFGPFSIEVFKPWSYGNYARRTLYDCWLEEPKANVNKRHVRPRQQGTGLYRFGGNGTTDKEAVAIVESLARVE